MTGPGHYCRTLNYEGAAFDRTRFILRFWDDGMSAPELYERMLCEGKEAGFSASSLKHSVCEVFKLRFLSPDALPWTRMLKETLDVLPTKVFEQACFLLTARCEAMLRDFLVMEYWPRVGRGEKALSAGTLKAFLSLAIEVGRGGGRWTESRFRRAADSLSAACSGFRLVSRQGKSLSITSPVMLDETALLLARDLSAEGRSIEALFAHEDWAIFGLCPHQVEALLMNRAFAPCFEVRGEGIEKTFDWKVNTLTEALQRYEAR